MKAKQPVSVSINPRLAKQASDLKLDVKAAAEQGLAQAIRIERERLWRLENASAIKAANEFVETNGLPFLKHQPF